MNSLFVKDTSFVFYIIIIYMIGLLVCCVYTFVKSYKRDFKDGFTQSDYNLNMSSNKNNSTIINL